MSSQHARGPDLIASNEERLYPERRVPDSDTSAGLQRFAPAASASFHVKSMLSVMDVELQSLCSGPGWSTAYCKGMRAGLLVLQIERPHGPSLGLTLQKDGDCCPVLVAVLLFFSLNQGEK